jgi:hypothetical protein
LAAYCLPTHLVLTQSRMRPWATPPTRERRFLCTAARPGTQGSRTDGWGEIDGLVPRVNTRAARALPQHERRHTKVKKKAVAFDEPKAI